MAPAGLAILIGAGPSTVSDVSLVHQITTIKLTCLGGSRHRPYPSPSIEWQPRGRTSREAGGGAQAAQTIVGIIYPWCNI